MVEPRYRILLVEDEYEVAEMLAIFFADRGFFLFHAGDGADALARAATIMPHLILMDISLPDMDGYEICRRLRQQPRTSHIPIIFLTRRGGRDDRLIGLDLGADDFISKPFDLEELTLRIRNSVKRAEREKQTDPRTGIPSALALRSMIDTTRTNPQVSLIEFNLDHIDPFEAIYGVLATAEVYAYLVDLLKEMINIHGTNQDFIGFVDERRYVILCEQSKAKTIAENTTKMFNYYAEKHYNQYDLVDGKMLVDGKQIPLMTLSYREIHIGESWGILATP